MIYTKLPNSIRKTQVLKLVLITIRCLKFWAYHSKYGTENCVHKPYPPFSKDTWRFCNFSFSLCIYKMRKIIFSKENQLSCSCTLLLDSIYFQRSPAFQVLYISISKVYIKILRWTGKLKIALYFSVLVGYF